MILLRANLVRFFHFTRPALSALQSLNDLQAILQKRLLNNIKDVNNHTQKHYSFTSEIAEQMDITSQNAEQIASRTTHISVVSVATNNHEFVEVNLNQNFQEGMLQNPDLFGLPFAPDSVALRHFSYSRGIPTFEELNQYSLQKNQLLMFNLPDNISQSDLQATFKCRDLKITFKYCLLGLPAYAKVEFPCADKYQKVMGYFSNKRVLFGDRQAKIKTIEDLQKIKLKNRRLSIHIEEDRQFDQMIIQLSKYGRVMHIDWPLQAWKNPSIEELKDHYKNSTQLIKINKIVNDQNIESEYYPTFKAWQNWQDEREEDNLIERAQKLKQSYEHRARFAKQINIYPGKEHELMIKNKGYCVVTYSTYEQGQNYYFANGAYENMDLVGDKLDFEYDQKFKKQLLRHVDSQYLVGKKAAYAEKKQHDKKYMDIADKSNEYDPYFQGIYKDQFTADTGYNLAHRILTKMYKNQAAAGNDENGYGLFKSLNQQNQFREWEEYINKMKAQKNKTQKKSFDQLAQIQLFGRVLPKDPKLQKMIVQDNVFKPSKESQLIKQNHLITDTRDIHAKNKFYQRQRERNNRIANAQLGITTFPMAAKVEQGIEEELAIDLVQGTAEVQGGDIGKQHFSTRKPIFYYRKRTPEEQAHYERRYFQFMRNTIYEYMGVFHDKLIEEVVDHRSQILNPRSIKWADGSSYLTEEELTDVLQFRRNFQSAQEDYDNYVYGNEFVKSAGINLNNIHANFAQYEPMAIQHLMDVGVVEQVSKVNGDDLEKKVDILNAQTAEFGEQYILQQNQNEHFLVKMRKLQPLLPLDRVDNIQNFIRQVQEVEEITQVQVQVFSKYYKQMKENDVIPDQVSEAFEIEKGKRFSDLLAEVGVPNGISRKDLQMIEKSKTYISGEVSRDIDEQMRIERTRKNFRFIDSNSFSKDPSQIYVKDREGYYKVSRYRQI